MSRFERRQGPQMNRRRIMNPFQIEDVGLNSATTTKCYDT